MILWPWVIRGGESLAAILCHDSNGIYGSLIRVSRCILWKVETHFLESYRDPTYNWFWVLKPKKKNGLRLGKFEKVHLGMRKVIKIPMGSHGPFYFIWPPIAKIAMCVTRKNLVSNPGQKLFFWKWEIMDKGILDCNFMPIFERNLWFLNLSLKTHSMASRNSLPRAI